MHPQDSRHVHVLFLQGKTVSGGATCSLLDLIEALREVDYQAVVACPQRGWLTEQLERGKIPHVLLPFYAWRKLFERPRVHRSIQEHWLPALAGWNFQIVHSNELWWAPHAIEVARSLKVPVAVHLRDGRHTLKKACQYRLHKSDLVLAVSTELRNQFATNRQLYDKTRVLFNGHQERSFHEGREKARETFGLMPEEFVLGNAGKLSELKNQRLLLRTMAQLKQHNRVPQFKILFAGEGHPDYTQLMRDDVQRFGLQQEVQLLGWVQEMGAFFAATDLFVHCARQEGFPRVVAEAMLARRPVIAIGAGGVHDAIPDERFGSVVPIDNQHALENEIERILKNPGLRESIANQAYQRAQSFFSLEVHREKILGLYEGLLGQKATSTNPL